MNNLENINFDDENLLLYYMQLCNKYEQIISEIKSVLEHSDLVFGTKNYDYIMELLNKCNGDNYE